MRKIKVTLLAISMLVLAPAAGWGFGPGSAKAGGDPASGGFITQQATRNAGEAQQVSVGNKVYGGEDRAKGTGTGTGTMDRLQQRLQTMQQDRQMLREDWQTLREDLSQMKEQYKQTDSVETRVQIKNMYKNAFQLARQQDNIEAAEDIISLDPRDADNFRELGAIYRYRGEKDPKVFCDGNQLKPDAPPVIKEGRTLVPVRAITEGMGAVVQWNEAEQTVSINKGEISIQLQVRNRVALVNGREIALEVPAEINSNRVFVPLRFISEALQAEVAFYPDGQIVTVNQ